MKTPFAFLAAALLVLSTNVASASEVNTGPQLDAMALAEVLTTGGFMAPGYVNTTIDTIKKDGTIERTIYHREEPPVQRIVTQIGRLDAATQLRLERAIARVHEGILVDENPHGPIGADGQNINYLVNQNGKTLSVADRRGDFHTYVLRQKAARIILQILEQAVRP